MAAPLTQQRLRALLEYDEATGVFRWIVHRKAVRVGDVAGCIKKGYRAISVDGKSYRASRLAYLYMTGRWPPYLIDHEDCNKANDAWHNIRPATHGQNRANVPVQAVNSSGFKGVTRLPKGRWQATFQHRYLGSFDTPALAHAAYVAASSAAYGEYARAA